MPKSKKPIAKAFRRTQSYLTERLLAVVPKKITATNRLYGYHDWIPLLWYAIFFAACLSLIALLPRTLESLLFFLVLLIGLPLIVLGIFLIGCICVAPYTAINVLRKTSTRRHFQAVRYRRKLKISDGKDPAKLKSKIKRAAVSIEALPSAYFRQRMSADINLRGLSTKTRQDRFYDLDIRKFVFGVINHKCYTVFEADLSRLMPHLLFDSRVAKGRQFRRVLRQKRKLPPYPFLEEFFDIHSFEDYDLEALSVITPEIIESMIALKDCDIEFLEDRLFCYAPLLPAEEFKIFQQECRRLHARLSDSASSRSRSNSSSAHSQQLTAHPTFNWHKIGKLALYCIKFISGAITIFSVAVLIALIVYAIVRSLSGAPSLDINAVTVGLLEGVLTFIIFGIFLLPLALIFFTIFIRAARKLRQMNNRKNPGILEKTFDRINQLSRKISGKRLDS